MNKNVTSITHFINRRITIIYLIVLFISSPLIYSISVKQMENEAVIELNNMTQTLKQLSPELFGNAISSNNTTAQGFIDMLQTHDSYFYRFVSAEDMSSSVQFSKDNWYLINQFMTNPALDSISNKLIDDNEVLVYEAFPVKTYGGSDSFVMFGIQLDRFSNIILVRVATFIGLMTILYAIIISSMNTTLRSNVINPLLRINNRTKSVANGEINKVFKSERQDEIGELIKSIELLRRSLSISMDLYEKNAKKKAS